MHFPENLKYTKDHEWTKIDGKIVTIGITDHAQSSLGDVVYVELPKVGRILREKETFGVVESIKAVSDLYSPVAGKVVEVNSILEEHPEKINQDPHQGAWMIKIEIADSNASERSHPPDLSDLMDAQTYENYVDSL